MNHMRQPIPEQHYELLAAEALRGKKINFFAFQTLIFYLKNKRILPIEDYIFKVDYDPTLKEGVIISDRLVETLEDYDGSGLLMIDYGRGKCDIGITEKGSTFVKENKLLQIENWDEISETIRNIAKKDFISDAYQEYIKNTYNA